MCHVTVATEVLVWLAMLSSLRLSVKYYVQGQFRNLFLAGKARVMIGVGLFILSGQYMLTIFSLVQSWFSQIF